MTESAKLNLDRKSRLIDTAVQLHPDGYPLPVWIELSPTELCNRKCVFCPKSDPERYPNRPLHMLPSTYRALAAELLRINYHGTVVLAGYGEPMLSPHIIDMIDALSKPWLVWTARVELVTNGDKLTLNRIEDLFISGLAMFVVNLYDGAEQVEEFHGLFSQAGIPKHHYLLRDRWHGADLDYGVKLTNRAGVVTIGNQPLVMPDAPCHYPAYSMMVNWNGDCYVCGQDWNREVVVGNITTQPLPDIWNSPLLKTYRMNLTSSRRGLSPCHDCNACGTLHGAGHAAAWAAYYGKA